MAALSIISAWAILLHIRTGKYKFMIMESSHRNASHITGHREGNPPVNIGPHAKDQ